MTSLASPILSSPVPAMRGAAGHEVSLFHLYALRAAYLLIVVGLGSEIWPAILHHRPWDLWHGVGCCLLGAISALAVLGLRYPLKMLPLLLFEVVWKTTWLLAIALPAWRAGQMDAGVRDTATACLMGVIFPIVIPWPYVLRTWVLARGDRWGRSRG